MITNLFVCEKTPAIALQRKKNSLAVKVKTEPAASCYVCAMPRTSNRIAKKEPDGTPIGSVGVAAEAQEEAPAAEQVRVRNLERF